MDSTSDESTNKECPDERLRQRAEQALRIGSVKTWSAPMDTQELIHELQVHHVELDMQNEDLRLAQHALAESSDHYIQLYDFSPAGYVTHTPEGLIEEANLRFCALLGVPRKQLLQQGLVSFIAPQDWEVFRRHCVDVLAAPGTMHTCKLRLLPKSGAPLIMQVESLSVTNVKRPGRHIETAMLDRTHQEAAEIAARESERKVQKTAVRLLMAQADERRRIARDLHDDHCQRVTAAILELGMLPKRHPAPWTSPAEHLKPVKAILGRLLSDLRGFSHDLYPHRPTPMELEDALRALLADFTETSQIVTELHVTLGSMHPPQEICACLYHILQESLSNVRKHAQAKMVSVVVRGLPDSVELFVKDDGQGFVPEAVNGLHHLGLISMRERVEELQGKFSITSQLRSGTTLSIQIPLPPGQSGEQRQD